MGGFYVQFDSNPRAKHCSSVFALSLGSCSSRVVYSNICLLCFIFFLRPEKYEVIFGPLEKLLSEAMYQMICFRFCSRIQRILQHIIPRKVIAFFEDTFFMDRVTFLCLLMLRDCF